jgi:hypothetical protein
VSRAGRERPKLLRRAATDDGENSIGRLLLQRRRRRRQPRVEAQSGSPTGQRVEEEEPQNGSEAAATSGASIQCTGAWLKDGEGMRGQDGERSMYEKAKRSPSVENQVEEQEKRVVQLPARQHSAGRQRDVGKAM